MYSVTLLFLSFGVETGRTKKISLFIEMCYISSKERVLKQKRGTSMNIDKIIKQVAKAHNTTPEEVYAEMQIALDAAFQSNDPEVQREWAKIPFKGDRPTPEDVIPYLVGQLKNPQEAVS